MKRFFFLILQLWKQQFKLYLAAACIGALAGIFILYPINEFVYFHEHDVGEPLAGKYVVGQLKLALQGKTPNKTVFYIEVGTVLGLLIAWGYGFLHKKLQRIEQLSEELDRDIVGTLQQGEGPMLEFKSSFRWDMDQSRINRALEGAVLKTLAGYLNSHHGGTLLIGVADDGTVLGLQNDYQSLKRQDQDGFEQAIMAAVSTNLGADLCQYVQVLFHVIGGKDICRLIVHQSPRPVFLKQGNGPKFFLRTGGGTRDLNIQEATEFIATRFHK